MPRLQLPAQVLENAAQTPTTRYPPMFDKPYADMPEDFLDDDYDPNRKDDDSDEDSSEQETRSGQIDKRHGKDLFPEKYFSPDGKMFQSEVYTNLLNTGETKLNSINGKKSFEDLKKKADGLKRKRRQVGEDDPLMSDGK